MFADQNEREFEPASSAAAAPAAAVAWRECAAPHTDQQDQVPGTPAYQEGQATELLQVQHQQESWTAETPSS